MSKERYEPKPKMPLFSLPFPLRRIVAPQVQRARVNFRACSTNEVSPTVARLRIMQKRILDRRNSLRAQGIRGKADKEKYPKGLREVFEDLELSTEPSKEVKEPTLTSKERSSSSTNHHVSEEKKNSMISPNPGLKPVDATGDEQLRSTVETKPIEISFQENHPDRSLADSIVHEDDNPLSQNSLEENHPLVIQRKRLALRRRETKPTSAIHPILKQKDAMQGAHIQSRNIHSSVESNNSAQLAESAEEKPMLVKRSGSLPWKIPGKQERNSVEERIFLFPLSNYLSDDTFTRLDGSLPKKHTSKSKKSVSSSFESTPVPTPVKTDSDCRKLLQHLNERQIQAVQTDCDAACLVLAGPGSGKTRVLTHRIAYLMKQYNVPPYRILAVTFTNKAADEMRERVFQLLSEDLKTSYGDGAEQYVKSSLALGTFHSISARLLRKHGDKIGISPNFDICDTSDTRQVLSRIIKQHQNVAPDSSTLTQMRSSISKLKNDDGTLKRKWPQNIYKLNSDLLNAYQNELRANNLLDFDDLLLETRRMLLECSEVRDELQSRFEYVLVDEWQDTNQVQFDLVSLLTGKQNNLFVVGDADQSIYKFRGADSGNVKRFYETFSRAKTIILDRNYRSTGCIVEAATSVIEKSTDRPEKPMTTMNDFGDRVHMHETYDDKAEANFIVSILNRLKKTDEISSFSNCAVMYRTNAQSRLLEEACIKKDIPYRLHAGVKFYQRQEIKDLIAYVKILINPVDDYSFRRVVNTPPRGIGKKTIETIEEYARSKNCSLSAALDKMMAEYTSQEDALDHLKLRKPTLKKVIEFHGILQSLRQFAVKAHQSASENEGAKEAGNTVDSVILEVLERTKYREYLESKTENEENNTTGGMQASKLRDRAENVDELVRGASRFETISEFLQNIALMSNADSEDESSVGKGSSNGAVSLMTLHAGKGLEFEAVFIIGVEDNVIPMGRAETEADIDEERRLLYVGMTRAKKQLYITWRAQKLMVSGKKTFKAKGAGPSRFLKDVPSTLRQGSDLEEKTSEEDEDDFFFNK